ncbi:hypothetical protein APHAL10511_003537 [Amanita phalloides]|nr:hypothetical protein APHAL10511_003537 [Amanita phalloides]
MSSMMIHGGEHGFVVGGTDQYIAGTFDSDVKPFTAILNGPIARPQKLEKFTATTSIGQNTVTINLAGKTSNMMLTGTLTSPASGMQMVTGQAAYIDRQGKVFVPTNIGTIVTIISRYNVKPES